MTMNMLKQTLSDMVAVHGQNPDWIANTIYNTPGITVLVDVGIDESIVNEALYKLKISGLNYSKKFNNNQWVVFPTPEILPLIRTDDITVITPEKNVVVDFFSNINPLWYVVAIILLLR